MHYNWSAWWSEFAFGCVITFSVSFIFILLLFGENRPNLETCAKEHDVFECEWIAQPKKQEKIK